ncbi:MAG: cytochrome c3 family protein [Bacillota bacterium]
MSAKQKLFVLAVIFFWVFAGSSLPSLSVSAQAYENPHGPYETFPAGCAACHVAHASLGPRLLTRETTTMLCLACHDGTGSIYDVVNAVYAGFGSTCGAVYFHPVKGIKDLLNNPAVGEIIECTYCHNPHGNTVNGQVYPRLLRSFDGTNRYYEGPEYCLACHGAVDHNFAGETDTYWENTLGDHRNSYAAHYLTAAPELLPASGTKVTCVMCHNKHAAPNSRLLAKVEENLCWSCHVKEGQKVGSIHPVRAFSKTGSVHNVDGAGGSKLECSSCHGPHTINYLSFSVNEPGVYCGQCHNVPYENRIPYQLMGSYSVLSDPDNTKKKFAGAEGTGLGGLPNTVGDLSDFCLKCHDDSPPTAVADVYTYVPYTIVFPATNFTTNSGGWDKGIYKTSAHGKALTCGDCHESHGSDYPALQRHPEDTASKDGECLRCHKSGGSAPDIKTDLLKPSHHPTLDVSGEHRNTEDYTNISVRHAECADCHDVHVATKANAITGVSGVAPTYTANTPWVPAADYTFKKPVDHEYELCFKCHSPYSYNGNPPTSPSGGFAETDQTKEFNPYNPGYHAVVGESKIPPGYGKFVSPWTYNSPMKCTDCHGSDSGTAPKGPHGSTEAFILKARWNPNTSEMYATGKAGTQDHLCFDCHDYDFYVNGQGTETSKFSGGGDNCQCKNNLHGGHHAGKGCACCHGAIPHGYSRRGILVTTADDSPYTTGVKITGISVPTNPGQWQKKDCNTASGCHGGMQK